MFQEVVNLEAESKESSKSQDSQKSGVTLANMLDLELRWPREVEETDNNSSNNASSQVALVSLPGVDLDNFFSAQKNEVSSRSNTSHYTSNDPQVSAHDADSFSDIDTLLSGTRNKPVSSAQNGTVEQFMPREQDANTHVNLSPRAQKLGFFEGRHSLDAVNSSADAIGGESDDAFADWETDFQSANSVTFEAKSKRIDSVQSSEDFQTANPTSVTAEPQTMDLFHGSINYQSTNHETVGMESKQVDPIQNSSSFQPDNSTVLVMDSRTDDPFQNSVDFESANSEAVATDSRPIDLIKNHTGFQSRHIDHFQNSSTDFSPIIVTKSDQNTNIGQNSGKDLAHEVDQLALRNDWFQDDMWSQISTKSSKQTDQLESTSITFVGELKNEEKETASLSGSWTRDDLWQSSTDETNITKSLNHHDDDLFDDWQDFTAATNSSILQSLTSDKKVHVIPSEVIPDASDLDSSKYKVDVLLAQMPDLSFMLEESLYIPKKPSGSELNT